MFLSSITTVDLFTSSLVQHESARQVLEASAAFKIQRIRPQLQIYVTMPFTAFISKMSNVLNSLKTLISLEKYGLETA